MRLKEELIRISSLEYPANTVSGMLAEGLITTHHDVHGFACWWRHHFGYMQQNVATTIAALSKTPDEKLEELYAQWVMEKGD